MLTFKDDLARKVLETHFDGLTADYGLKFCKEIINTVLDFDLNHYAGQGTLTIEHVLEMWENNEIGICEDCEEEGLPLCL